MPYADAAILGIAPDTLAGVVFRGGFAHHLHAGVYANSQVATPNDVNSIPLKTVGNASILVGDVGHAVDGGQLQTNIVRVDGQHSVYIPVLKQGGGSNTITIVDGIRKATARLLDVPQQLKTAVVFDQSVFVKTAIKNVISEGAIGRSGYLPQIYGAATAEKAEDGSRIGVGSLTDSRLYTHTGAGGTLTQLITDFGHTRDLIATNKLQQKAQDRTTIATEQDVLLATDEAFYRLLNGQSLLNVAKATMP